MKHLNMKLLIVLGYLLLVFNFVNSTITEFQVPQRTCARGSFWTDCGTACPINCCNVDNPPAICILPCVFRCECPPGKVEIYEDNGDIKKCKDPSTCPSCPLSKPMRCDVDISAVPPYLTFVGGSADPPVNALSGSGSSITISHNGDYIITKPEDFYVLGISYFVANAKKVNIKGKAADGTLEFASFLPVGDNPNGGISPGGMCTLPKKTVRVLMFKFKGIDQGNVTLSDVKVNACCSLGLASPS